MYISTFVFYIFVNTIDIFKMQVGEIVYVRYGSNWYEAKLIALGTTATVRWLHGSWAMSTTPNVSLECIFPMESVMKKKTQDETTQPMKTQTMKTQDENHAIVQLQQEVYTMRQEVIAKLQEIQSLVFFDVEDFLSQTFD